MHYYLIHGGIEERKIYMENQFYNNDVPFSDIRWIIEPRSVDSIPNSVKRPDLMKNGAFICTYKHFLALEDICKNEYDMAVIMEDNIRFDTSVPARIEKYLSDLPNDWSILFDSDICGIVYNENPISANVSVYKKDNAAGVLGGSSKGANFYLLKLETAKILYENYLPITATVDWHYNHLFRKLNLNSYWAEPPNVHHVDRPSTAFI
jgi:GR25 family glycosyltransferase involved in LPS biosynthesis